MNMSFGLVFIIPAYNAAATLGETLRSVLSLRKTRVGSATTTLLSAGI